MALCSYRRRLNLEILFGQELAKLFQKYLSLSTKYTLGWIQFGDSSSRGVEQVDQSLYKMVLSGPNPNPCVR